MNKIYMPSHKDGGNRGCEAITRGTARILNISPDRLISCSNDIELDRQLGISDVTELRAMVKPEDETALKRIYHYLKKYTIFDREKRRIYKAGYLYDDVLKDIDRTDLALSTGGDMFCYKNNEVIYINNKLTKRHIKTVLWGCSIGEENLTPEKMDTLKKFSLIIARESLTEQVLKKAGLTAVEQFPDPAFVLEPEECSLPEYMYNGKMIGMNLSNFVNEDVSFDSFFGQNIIALLDYILSDTDLHVVLIPHVFWQRQDDRIVCNMVYKHYEQSGRVHLLDSSKLNYCQIRYAISKCRYFIGARTHSMVSAYSTEVPALALGYSIKSRGIARDLGLDERLVVDCKHLQSKMRLKEAFEYLVMSEEEIRQVYKTNLAPYIQSAYGAERVLKRLEVR